MSKYMAATRISDDVEDLRAEGLAVKLGMSDASASEVRKVMAGTAGKPNVDTLGKYFKALEVKEEDRNYVHGIGVVSFTELTQAIQASADFGPSGNADSEVIRDLKRQAQLAKDDGKFEEAVKLSAKILKFQTEDRLYSEKDLTQKADNEAGTLAFLGSLGLQMLDFEQAFENYSKIPKINGVSSEVVEKFINPIRISYNARIYAQADIDGARAVFAEMAANDVPPDVFSYTTLLKFLDTEAEVRDVFAEMKKNKVPPNVVSYTTLLTFLDTEAEVRDVFAEMKKNKVPPNEITVITGIKKCENFGAALEFSDWCLTKKYFVGQGAYKAVYSFPVADLPAAELLAEYHARQYSRPEALESPINQYRNSGQADQALRLLFSAPYVGAAQKFYREDYKSCKAYFDAELAAGNDEANLHYAYGIAAAAKGDCKPARRHLNIALERCFESAHKRRKHIQDLLKRCA